VIMATTTLDVMGRKGRRVLDMRGVRLERDSSVKTWEMFEVEWSVGTTSVKVHGGGSARWTGGATIVGTLAVDSGTSNDPSDYKTVTGLTTSQYLALAVPSAASGNITVETGYAAPDLSGFGLITLAYVQCSAGVIVNVIQWSVDALLLANESFDSVSLNFNSATQSHVRQVQVFGYQTATASVPTSAALVLFQPGIDEGTGDPLAMAYANHAGFVDWLDDAFAALVHGHTWNALTDVADFAEGTALDLPRLNAAKDAIEWVHPNDLLGGVLGDTVTAINICAPIALGGPLHNLLVLGHDIGEA
jgi:hypothetical protein